MVSQQLCRPPHTCVRNKPSACLVLPKYYLVHTVGISQQCLTENCYFGPELDLQRFSKGCGLAVCPSFPFSAAQCDRQAQAHRECWTYSCAAPCCYLCPRYTQPWLELQLGK